MRNYLNLFFRDGTALALNKIEVDTLRANFKELHKIDHKTGKPNKIQLFYTLVRDFSDVRTQELVLDQAWYVLITCFHESGIFLLFCNGLQSAPFFLKLINSYSSIF